MQDGDGNYPYDSREAEPLLSRRATVQGWQEGVEKRPTLDIPVEQDVYSAILFLPAVSRIKDGHECGKAAQLAFMLCCVNAVIQIGVVQVINVYNHKARAEDMQNLVLQEDIMKANDGNWLLNQERKRLRSSMEAYENSHKQMLPPQERAQLEEVGLIKPLCRRTEQGAITCLPDSLEYINEWKNLDTDGDGIWSLKEAQDDKANLKAKYGISPESIFRNAVHGFRLHSMQDKLTSNSSFYLSTEIQSGLAIPKAYFNYWMGDAMMCTLSDSSLCEAGAKAGVFGEALRPGRVSVQEGKGIFDLDSALHYCSRMLERGGFCEQMLPMDYKRTREQRKDRCGRRELVEGGTYVNPHDANQVVHVLTTNYKNVDLNIEASAPLFLCFLSLIIMLWLLSLISEWRYILKKAEFLYRFPGISASNPGGHCVITPRTAGEEGDEVKEFHVTGISRNHRAVCVLVWLSRFVVLCVLTQFGTTFLIVEQRYLDLVLNSLALTFILQIDGMLYEIMESSTKEEMESCKTLVFETHMPKTGFFGYILKKECWGLFLVPIVSVLIVIRYTYLYKLPVLEVFQCACNQEGPNCMESTSLLSVWWGKYWSHTFPAAMHQIEAMRVAGA